MSGVPITNIRERDRDISNPYCLLPNVQEVGTLADRHRIIREVAYYLAERRRFAPGHDLDDWLLAEKLVQMILVASLS